MTQELDPRPVKVMYTNWKGFAAVRTIIPKRIWYGTTPHHVTPQWLLDVHDVEKDAPRTYSLRDIATWDV